MFLAHSVTEINFVFHILVSSLLASGGEIQIRDGAVD